VRGGWLDMTLTDWIASVTSAGALVVAAGAWQVSRKSRDDTRTAAIAAKDSADAARASANAAVEISSIERKRRHDEMTPEFEFKFRAVNPHSKSATLAIELVSPVHLDFLDSIVVTFRTDGMARAAVDNVFGPVRFEFGHDDAPNRVSSAPKSILRGEFVLLGVQATSAHSDGWTELQWAKEFHNQPVRLRIDCVKEGFEPWFVTVDIDAPPLQRVEDTVC